jgi:2-methylisocitrate lyase-like PEP mutase family enzyme
MSPGQRLRSRVQTGGILPFVGVFDAFSASLAEQKCEGIFLSGFGFAASHYGFPDIGFLAWPDIVEYVGRIRTIAPTAHMVVDIDDGFVDIDVAVHVVNQLERLGASGLILEDQARPRKCGHFGNKNLLDLDSYLMKLESVLEASELFVVARTDASDPVEIRERVLAFSDTGADAILVDGQSSLDSIAELRELTDKPLAFNQILGGKSASFSLTDLEGAGASLAIFSTPLLFAAQASMEQCIDDLTGNDMRLDSIRTTAVLSDCQAVLERNWSEARRVDKRPESYAAETAASKSTNGREQT